MNDWLPWLALLLSAVASVALLLFRDWRWNLIALAAIYSCTFLLVQSRLPVTLAAAKLLTGLVACSVIFLALVNRPAVEWVESSMPRGALFRFFSSGMIITSTFILAGGTSAWLGLGLPLAWASLLLMGMGLLQLGITTQPFRITLGLLVTLSGFEIIYSSVESSTLVMALLAIITLGMALTCAYLVDLEAQS